MAAKRAAAGPSRGNAGEPPLKTKAEKRAEAKATKARALARRKRNRALTVAGSAVAVVAVVVGLVVWIGYAISQTEPLAASPSAEPTPAVTESSAAFPPVPAGADPALNSKPVATAGTEPVTELKATPLIKGTGAAVQAGQTITVNYVGVTYADGQEFDASWNSQKPFTFQLGAGNVIQGWDQGLVGATVGSRVQLDIPAALAYGENPSGGQPAGTLRFIVDVLSAS